MELQSLAISRCDAETEDLISGLPDELLHTILIRLPSAGAAARTSVLSRRWRGVWAHMPELVIRGSPTPATTTSALVDSVDAALNSYSAPTLFSLEIDVTEIDRCAAYRIAPWLRFSSQRLAGTLCLNLCVKKSCRVLREDMNEELALPIFERATEIELCLLADFVLRPPPPPGSFSALADLSISCLKMDGGELGRLVSSLQCPRLQKLYVLVVELASVCDVSICSKSLECLEYKVLKTGKLEVNAPMLQEISVSHHVAEACIVAPKLENVEWSSRFNPAIHHFSVAGRHLQVLDIMHSSRHAGGLISSTRLMQRFDTAKELKICLNINQKIRGYMTFLKDMVKLPICESLVISLMVNHHSLPAMLLHLLRRCICTKKLKLFLALPSQLNPPKVTPCSISGCPCLLPENYRLDGITFDSLEEIKINFFTGSDEQEQFMKLLLSKCHTVTLKRVDITVPFDPVSLEIMEVADRIRNVCHPNRKVQFNVFPRMLIQFYS